MTTPQAGRILAVDDNRINRMTLARTLEQEGHDVRTAEGGEQALEQLRTSTFDVVLLDVLMPGMDGFEVLSTLKADPVLRDLPVIVISALDDVDSAVRCIEMGAEDYLPKPFNPVLLRARLGASLRRKQLRDMEKAYLQQEVMLRQNERLATLGKLSAGMAHELNNPAAAALRGAAQLKESLDDLESAFLEVGKLPVDPDRDRLLRELVAAAAAAAHDGLELQPLEQSDRIAELEDILVAAGMDEPWQVAPELVDTGLTAKELAPLMDAVPVDAVPAIVRWLTATSLARRLLDEIVMGTSRITELVKALKAYTYLDQAPLQDVDVHEGLNSTLVILRSKLRKGVSVSRRFAEGLPMIQGYGSELNQVWTNIIDNAIDAMDGSGSLELETRFDDAWVIVGIQDSGSGIDPDILPKLFDPFFTTKPPGSGTGLGLNISHAIVVEKHKGRIDVESEPGRTRFEVRLPRHADPSHAAADVPE